MEGNEVLWLESAAAAAGQPVTYLSSGVHGDEPGAACGLLAWALANEKGLRAGSFLIFPCLNPVGLMNNTRVDGRGLDLNRRFHMDDDPVCGPWAEVVKQREMPLGICLHEDYDAQGMYVYELSRHPKGWSAEILRRIATKRLPVEPGKDIDGRAMRDGVIQRKRSPTGLPGMPEAVRIFELGCPVSLTFETPSEFSLDDRVRAQARFVSIALKLAGEWEKRGLHGGAARGRKDA